MSTTAARARQAEATAASQRRRALERDLIESARADAQRALRAVAERVGRAADSQVSVADSQETGQAAKVVHAVPPSSASDSYSDDDRYGDDERSVVEGRGESTAVSQKVVMRKEEEQTEEPEKVDVEQQQVAKLVCQSFSQLAA